MTAIALIAYRLIVLRFFRKNFSVFLVLSLLTFGIIQPPFLFFTEEFAQVLFSNVYLIGTVMVFGALYTAWIFQVLTRYAKHPDHEYLQVLPAMGKRKSFAIAVWLSIGMQTPLIAYFLITTLHGFSLGSPLAFATLGLCLFYVLMPAAGLHHYLFTQRPLFGASSGFNLSGLFRKDRVFILHLGHLWNTNPIAMLVIKGLSIGIVIAFCNGISPDEPDTLPFDIILTILVVLHALMPYWLFRSEDKYMPFLRSMPYSLASRLGQYALVYITLMIPEICVLFAFFLTKGHSPMLMLNFSLTLLGVCLLAQSLMLTTKLPMIDYVKIIFGFFIVQFILLLLGVPLALLSSLFVAVAILAFWRSYYKWEPILE